MQTQMEMPELVSAAPASSQFDDIVKFDYQEVKTQLDILLSEWEGGGGMPNEDSGNPIISFQGEQTLVKVRRELRRDTTDVNIKRTSGELSADENYIPQRLIDQHIAQDKPAQIAYLEQPDRLLVFKDLTDPSQPTGDIEAQFTDHMRYEGWLIPWHRIFDGSDLHGGCCLEVVLDPSKPFFSRIEYIRREDLVFPTEATDLQSCEYIMRRYFYMPFELESFVKKYGFDDKVISELCREKTRRHQRIPVYKVYCKKDGIVYQFWYHKTGQTFLKQPEVYLSGVYDPQEILAYRMQRMAVEQDPSIPPEVLSQFPTPQPLPSADYPIFFFPYEVIEDDRLLASKGLAFFRQADQESMTQLWTSTINRANRSADVYASYKSDPAGQTGVMADAPLKRNCISARQVEFWNFPPPDASLLSVILQYANNISAQSKRVDYAVNNRDDSRKTATEISASRQQAAGMTSVPLSGQSFVIVQAYELCWRIGLSHILLGEITTFSIPEDRLLHKYRFGSAGDVDIRKREDKKQVIRETFQYLVGTPIGNKFLEYLIETFFPERAKDWVPLLQQGDPTQIIAAAVEIFEAMLADPNIAQTMAPEDILKLQNVVNQMKSYVTTASQGGGNPGAAQVPNGTQPMAEPAYDVPANNLPKSQVGAVSGASEG